MQNGIIKNPNYNSELERLKNCLIPTFVIGLIAHAYGFLHNIFAHDSLNAFYADSNEEKWKIALGRFLVPVVRKTLTGSVALPWVIGLLSLLFISLSLYCITKIFNVDTTKKIPMLLLSGIMVTNITVSTCVATYIYELHFDMLALLLVCLSAYIWSKYDKIKWYLLSALLTTASMALYQSYTEVLLLLMIMFSINKLLDGNEAKGVFIKAIKGLATAIFGFVVYYGLYKLVLVVTKIDGEERTDALSVSGSEIVSNIIVMFKRIAKFYLKPASAYSSTLYAVVNVLILVMTASIIIYRIAKQHKAKEIVLTLVLGIAMLLSINIIAITGADVHDLMIYAYWVVFAFPIILLFNGKEQSKRCIKGISVILVGIFIWNNILVANTMYVMRDNEQSATLSAMTRVIEDLEERDDYQVGKSEIIFYGHIDVLNTDDENEYDGILGVEGVKYKTIMGGLEPEWYYNCYEAYFKYFLDYPLNYSDKTFSDRKEVQEMPCFPNDGYIQNIDGVIVVKMGDIDNMLKIQALEQNS